MFTIFYKSCFLVICHYKLYIIEYSQLKIYKYEYIVCILPCIYTLEIDTQMKVYNPNIFILMNAFVW